MPKKQKNQIEEIYYFNGFEGLLGFYRLEKHKNEQCYRVYQSDSDDEFRYSTNEDIRRVKELVFPKFNL
jgi:hypothetical protein